MGQKVHPTGIRLGIVKEWNAKWYANKSNYATTLAGDLKIREFITRRLAGAALSKIIIDRPAQNINITVFTARPGIVIGKKGEDIERLRHDLSRMNGVPVNVVVEEIRKPELDAKLVAENICQQLEKRIMFRRAMKRSLQNSMRLGAKGIKIMLAGRLNGAEIARTEWARDGRVPLHTLRADIDYGVHEAHTTYGIIGVKVWIFKGEVLAPEKPETPPAETDAEIVVGEVATPEAPPAAAPVQGTTAETAPESPAVNTPEGAPEKATNAVVRTTKKVAKKAAKKAGEKSPTDAPTDGGG